MTDISGSTPDQPEASDVDKIAGIVEQTRADAPDETAAEIAGRLRQRFEQSGIEIDDADVARIADDLAG